VPTLFLWSGHIFQGGFPHPLKGVLGCEGVMKGKREMRGKGTRKRGEKEENAKFIFYVKKKKLVVPVFGP